MSFYLSKLRIYYSDLCSSARSAFTDHSLPFPLVVVNSVSSSGNVSNTIDGAFVPLSNPIYEFNVCELLFQFVVRPRTEDLHKLRWAHMILSFLHSHQLNT